jgi:molecular chaperone DnaK
MSRIIGIDLGTTKSVMAVMHNGRPVVIPNAEGERSTATIVGLPSRGGQVTGVAAKRLSVTEPQNVISSITKVIGRRFEELGEQITVPYGVRRGLDGSVLVVTEKLACSPTELCAILLRRLKQDAEEYLGSAVDKAVITVPSLFDHLQRQAVRDACRLAGFEAVRLINASAAAALGYGFDKRKDETIAVCGFGGGTFDISILEVGEGVVEVKSVNGDTRLGGETIDQRIVDWIIEEFRIAHRVDLSKDWIALQRLKEVAERAKCELSSMQDTDITVPFITKDSNGPKHVNLNLTRARFERIVGDILPRTAGPCRQALKDAEVKASDIDALILIGGSTRIPKVREIVCELFGRENHSGINREEVVALGAAVQAGVCAGEVKDVLLLGVTPLSLGVETKGGTFTKLIDRNTSIPTLKSEIFSTVADNQPSVEIHILEGESAIARDNRTLGRFQLKGLPNAVLGAPQIEVTFDVDADGILNVSAKELGAGTAQRITLPKSDITRDPVDRSLGSVERSLGFCDGSLPDVASPDQENDS